ncbi:GSCFA domain-containing protein [Oscillatoria amoena NRMC-F 0135]|nr:GSCFA domain-containing protein [Oscillatoria amoena NRMC-F 0135]
MDFRLAFQPEGLPQKISYRQQVLLAGSCFAENIGNLLHHYRLNVLQNPNGILYNPVSIAQTLQRALEGKLYQAEELFHHNDLWASWQHHGRFSHPDKDTCIKGINEQQQAAQDFFEKRALVGSNLWFCFCLPPKKQRPISSQLPQIPKQRV